MEIINSVKCTSVSRGKRIFEGSGFYIPFITKQKFETILKINVIESRTLFKNLLSV